MMSVMKSRNGRRAKRELTGNNNPGDYIQRHRQERRKSHTKKAAIPPDIIKAIEEYKKKDPGFELLA